MPKVIKNQVVLEQEEIDKLLNILDSISGDNIPYNRVVSDNLFTKILEAYIYKFFIEDNGKSITLTDVGFIVLSCVVMDKTYSITYGVIQVEKDHIVYCQLSKGERNEQ